MYTCRKKREWQNNWQLYAFVIVFLILITCIGLIALDKGGIIAVNEPLVVTGLGFSIAIFVFQFMYSYSDSRKSDKILREINENVIDIKSITEIKNLNTHLINRIKENDGTTFIFYFPFSIYPGFWIDGGVEFKSFCSQLEGQNQNKYTNKFIFIGPKPDGILATSIFKIIETKSNNELAKVFQDIDNNKFYNFINARDNLTDTQLIDQIKNSYSESYNSIKGLSRLKNFIHIIEIDSPKNLPSYSFVLEVNGEQNLVFVDTFKILKERPSKIYNMGMDRFQAKQNDSDTSKQDKFNELSKIFATPTSYYFKNNIVSNLFLSSFLNICQNNNELTHVIESISKNNEHQN